MNRIVLGAVAALVLVSIGVFWWQARAEVEEAAPPPSPQALAAALPSDLLPEADIAGLSGPTPPEASELTREQRRFFRYDRDRNWRITRNEMLSTRSDAFRKLDTDGNNLLTFEEWAVTTAERFDGADADSDGELTTREFATTRPTPRKTPACNC